MNELLLKKEWIEGEKVLSIVNRADNHPVYRLVKSQSSMLTQDYTVTSESGEAVAAVKMEHILFTPAKLPKLTLSTKDGRKFFVKKEIEQLADQIHVEGENLAIKGDLFSEHFELLCGGKCIATFSYGDEGDLICAEERDELIAVLFAFGIELAK